MVRVTLPDGSTRNFDQAEVPVRDVVKLLDERAKGDTVGVLFGGQLRDVYQTVAGEGTLRPLRDGDQQSLYLLRHTASHVLAHAVQELFPDAKFAIGPPIDEGFYYDFEVDKPFTTEDLPEICAALEARGWLSARAYVYIEQPSKAGAPTLPANWTLLKSGRAGEVGYHLAQRAAEPPTGGDTR